ncbi:MAG: ATP-dependent Lon protease [Sphingobacteriales bacterium]|jgi:ATP-dependent Lon protease
MNDLFSMDYLNLSDALNEESDLIPIITDNDAENDFKPEDIPEHVSILPLRNTVLFPGVVIPITVGRDKSIKLIKEAHKKKKMIGVVAQRDVNIDDPEQEDLNKIGTLASILKVLKMPDGNTTVIIQGKKRFELVEIVQEDPFFKAIVRPFGGVAIPKDKEFKALIATIKEMAMQIIQLAPNIPTEASLAVKNIDNPSFLLNFIASNMNAEVTDKQKLLQQPDLKKRAEILLEHLTQELNLLELKNKIQRKVKTDIDQQQREYFLHQQMKTIQEELGAGGPELEIMELRDRGKKKKWNKDTAEAFNKEVSKLERMNPAAAEYGVTLNYCELLLDLPWNVFTKDKFDLKRGKRILDRDQHGLEKVKQRILEYLAVLKLKQDMKAPILCLVGPPGVGKTSLGRSVAEALGRKYVRVALGGVRDEADIRGHRKTYIGAMPGRVIQSVKKAKSSNPVFVLDEIDKVGSDFRGDPSSALLEVLDPEQNNAFADHYVELDYDLSSVMFIATANSLNNIQPALLDRMEIIEMSGYTIEEKIEIAKKHLVPKQLKEHGLTSKNLKFPPKMLERIVEDYTRESGVRSLEKKIATVARGAAKCIAMEEEFPKTLNLETLQTIMGAPDYDKEFYQNNDVAGVVTGLAWTSVGGDILFIESSINKGKGKLTLTGNLGDVMKESASLALGYIKAHAEEFGIPHEAFTDWDVHIHVPAGAVPKDGPSAGVTMLTSLVSAFTQRKVKSHLAMTGEITLRGKVLAVGGIKEKILAAKRANIKEIILCNKNRKDIEEINPDYIKDLTFHYVERMSEVIKLALTKESVRKPLRIVAKEKVAVN